MKGFKKILFLAFIFALSCVEVLAQTHKVTGVIKDVKGEPLIGVQIIPVGATKSGTITDFDGNYMVQVPKGIKQLKISYIGYITQTINIKGRAKINIVMKEDNKQLEAVVVTAMGIKRKSKTLTYATQSVSGKDLTRIKEPNFVNALRGKSAGLQITPNNSGAGGGSTKIVLRGQNSILGSNQPLIVLDGVPLSGGDEGGQAPNLLEGAKQDGGDILSTINPDDIASLTVLKGPNAAALYGSSANNGVLIITTKSGREGKLRVNVSTSTMVDMIALYPRLQDKYGLSADNSLSAWGKPISEMTADELASEPYYTKSPRNTIKDFFNLGLTQNTSLTISGGTAKSQTYFSYANTYQTGIMPGNKFMRHNVMLKQSYKLWEKLKLNLSLNYIHHNTKNRPVAGRMISPLYALYRTPANIDMRYFKHNYQHLGGDNDDIVTNPNKEAGNPKLRGKNIQTWYWYDQGLNNPYWLLNKVEDEAIQDRLLGTLSVKVDILEGLNFQSRTNLDYRLSEGYNNRYASIYTSRQHVGGRYWSNNGRSIDFFQDALLSYNKSLTDKLSFQAIGGASYSRSYNRNKSMMNDMSSDAEPNIFLPDNNKKEDKYNKRASTLWGSDRWGDNWYSAIFATTTFGWDDKVFVDGSYRLEWAKSFQQFATDDNYISFSYYSLGANAQLDKIFKFGEQVNSMKLRTSFSVVGNPIPNSNFSAQYIDFNSGAISAPLPRFDNPQPETTTSFEVGLDGAFFNNRWDFDLTFYLSQLENQFLYVNGVPKNTGKIRNWGVEFATNYRYRISKDLLWKTGFNIAYNDNKLIDTYVIPETGKDYIYSVGGNKFKIKYVKGGSFGDIYVNSFQKDEKGHIKLNAEGAPLLADNGFRTMVGNATAPINFGFNNTFSYKDFQFYFLLDGKIGGKVMSFTQADMDYFGVSEGVAEARDRGFVELPDGSGRQIKPELYYKTVGGNPNELYVYDASNLRLREMSLGYTFYDLLGPSKNLSLNLLARNLFFIYKDSPVDPDISQSTANGFGGIDAYAMPTTRTFGLSAKLTF